MTSTQSEMELDNLNPSRTHTLQPTITRVGRTSIYQPYDTYTYGCTVTSHWENPITLSQDTLQDFLNKDVKELTDTLNVKYFRAGSMSTAESHCKELFGGFADTFNERYGGFGIAVGVGEVREHHV